MSIRWGILSTAKIARDHIVPAINASTTNEVVAVGSRDGDRANAFADHFGIERRYSSYEALLADDEIDAIYNPLPNHLHASLTLQAAAAGKHVLCEKPITMNGQEAAQLGADLAALGNGTLVMEAFMYQFHPQWEAVLAMVNEGRIGELVTVQTWFSYFGDDPANIRNIPQLGGGALMDIGCYAIHSARRIFRSEPTKVQGRVKVHPTFGVDIHASGILDFESSSSGGHATFTVSTMSNPDQRVHIVGTEGRIELTRPYNAMKDQPMVVRVGSSLGATYGEPLETLSFGPADQYQLLVERFSDAIESKMAAPVPFTDAIANMTVIDAMFESAGFNLTN